MQFGQTYECILEVDQRIPFFIIYYLWCIIIFVVNNNKVPFSCIMDSANVCTYTSVFLYCMWNSNRPTEYLGGTMQSVKFVMAKNSNCIYPHTIPIEGFTDLQRPNIYKFSSSVVYEFLQVPHIPFDLDYVEVLSALCEALSKLYDKFLHEECFRYGLGKRIVDAISYAVLFL